MNNTEGTTEDFHKLSLRSDLTSASVKAEKLGDSSSLVPCSVRDVIVVFESLERSTESKDCAPPQAGTDPVARLHHNNQSSKSATQSPAVGHQNTSQQRPSKSNSNIVSRDDVISECPLHPKEYYEGYFKTRALKNDGAAASPQRRGSYMEQAERDSLDGQFPSSLPIKSKDSEELRSKDSKDPKLSKKETPPVLSGIMKSKRKSESKSASWPVDKEPFNQLWVALSALYGKAVVVLMLAFCLTEVMDNSFAPLTFQGVFLIYLYVGSILAITCIYVTLLLDHCPSVTRSRENLTSSDLETGSMSSFDTLRRAHISRSKTPRTSFYLRIGALVFGLATLIFNGLEIGMHATMSSKCVNEILFAHPILQALFTFLQMHFLFVNSEVLVEKFGMLARFGFIHLAATNVAMWIRTVVWESANEWIHYLYHQNQLGRNSGDSSAIQTLQLKGYPSYMTGLDYSYFNDDDTAPASNNLDYIAASEVSGPVACNSTFSVISEPHIRYMVSLYECFNDNTLGKIWTSSMSYMFPFLVEYNLIAAAVAYIMWRSVGKAKHHKKDVAGRKSIDSGSKLSEMQRKGYWRVDCQSASKGLFLGLLCLVGGIIVLIIFFVMKGNTEFRDQLFWISTGTQSVILMVACVLTCFGFVQLPKLSLSDRKPLNLDRLLANVSTYGVYIFAIFGVIVGASQISQLKHMALLVSCLLLVVQVALQSCFMAEAGRRMCISRYQMHYKPGRQIVTFLLFANITLWLLDTFMNHTWITQELQFSFYGFLAWGIISRISLPLVVFYRFHSAVVLIEIWKNTYRTRQT